MLKRITTANLRLRSAYVGMLATLLEAVCRAFPYSHTQHVHMPLSIKQAGIMHACSYKAHKLLAFMHLYPTKMPRINRSL